MKRTILKSIALLAFIIIIGAASKSSFVKQPDGYVFVQQGSVEIDGKLTSFQAFFMSKKEVTNGEYQVFLNDLLKQGKIKEYDVAKIDTSLWLKVEISGASSYASTYHKNKDCPVVNITKEGAKLYCDWMSEKLNKNFSDIKTQFRLPMEKEWEYAASSAKGTKELIYPWSGVYVKDSKGCILAQFKSLGNIYGPIKTGSFKANNTGLFDMSGNVSEMVSDNEVVKGGNWNSNEADLKIESTQKYESSPMVGFRPVITFLSKK